VTSRGQGEQGRSEGGGACVPSHHGRAEGQGSTARARKLGVRPASGRLAMGIPQGTRNLRRSVTVLSGKSSREGAPSARGALAGPRHGGANDAARLVAEAEGSAASRAPVSCAV